MKRIFLFLFVLFSLKSNSQVAVAGYITTIGVSDYPTHYDSMGFSGYRVARDITERDAIFCKRRKFGMAVYVQSVGKIYILKDSACNNVWEEFKTSSAAIDSIRRKVASDSVFGYINGVAIFQFKDSSGGAGTVTKAVDSVYKKIIGDTIFVRYNNGITLKLGGTDTTSLSNRINLKLNAADTLNYLKKSDTSNKFVNSILKNTTKDSIVFFIGGNRYAIKDSSNTLSGTGTVTSISQGYGISNSPNPITTTGTISVDSATLSSKYIRISDTSTMLSSYVPKTRTISTTAPLSGGGNLSSNLTLSMPPATTSANGYLTSGDWNTFNGKVSPSRTISTTAPLAGGGNLGSNLTLSMPAASSSANGYLTSVAYNIFAGKQSAIIANAPLNLSSAPVLTISKASSTDSGYLSSVDYNRFLNKVDTIYRNGTNDSIVFTIDSRRSAIPSGTGTGTGSDTATVVVAKVTNAEATTLLRGEVVYLFGATGDRASVKRAFNLGDSTSSKTFGFVRDSIQAGDTGYIVTQGQISKLNLGAYTAGQTIYLDSVAGKFTSVKPVAPKHLVVLGVIERANAGNGLLYVKPQNGYELDELHNVSVNGTKNNSVLYYDSTNKLWKATNGPIVTKIIAGTNITLTSPATGTGDVTINASTVGIQSVSGSSPIVVTNPTTTPTIGINQATSTQNGYLTATDWNTFNGKVSSVSASGLLTSTGGTTPTISSSMSANKLVGRNATTSGAFQEITLGSGLSMTGTTLSATGGGGGGSQNLQQVLDTGYTLNGNFYFQTNTSDSIVNLSGSLLTASRTYNFPDANGTIALTSDLTPPSYSIDLTSANYGMGGYGTYQIKVGTDSTTPYYISFPSASSNTGKRITLVNNDNTSFNNAIIDTSENAPKYQGTGKTLWDIPYGMSYEFLSIDGNWMCTSPTPVYVDTFASDYDGTGITTYNISFNGTYKLVNVNGSKQNDYYIVTFPDPKKNNGERITLINADTLYSLKIEGTWIPVSKSTLGGLVLKVAPQSTYEFVSIDSQWVCVNKSTPPTYPNVDLSLGDFKIQSAGVYKVVDASANALIFPDPLDFDGQTIIVINSDVVNDVVIGVGNEPVYAGGTSPSLIGASSTLTMISIGGKWFITNEF